MRPLRYVILRHEGIADPHFDLMVETRPGSDLATWRLAAWPLHAQTPAQRLKDHRRAFLDYQGDLTGNRGSVHRIDHGDCEVSIDEGATWRLTLQTGGAGTLLLLKQLEAEQWTAIPARQPGAT